MTTAKLADGAVTAVKVAADVATQAELDAKVSGHVVEDEGTPLAQRGTLNFTGPGVAVTDVGGKTTVSVDTSGLQPLDADLTSIAGLTPSNDDVVQRKAGAWTNRTPAQVKTDLALVKGDVGLGNVDNTSDANKPVSTVQQTALDLKAPLASPALTGVPTVPTAGPGTNTTQAASTAYVQTEAGLLVPKSLVDAKGDLLVGTADNTVARLAAGTNGLVLTTDSTQSSGLKWAARDARALPPVGRYLTDPAAVVSNTPTTGRLTYMPVIVPYASTWDRLGVRVEDVSAASGTVRLGVFAADASGLPGALVLDGGTAALGSGFTDLQVTISLSLDPSLYWLGAQFEGTWTTLNIRCSTTPAPTGWASIGSMGASADTGLYEARTGALPSAASGSLTPATSAIPRVGMRRS